MKKATRVILMGMFLSLTFANKVNDIEVTIPEPNDSFYVLDSADLLTPETEQTIIEYNLELEKTEEKPQFVVVTIPSTEDNSIEEYAVDLFESWGIGNADYDNGVLLLVTADGHERLEIGYGLEGAIPDALAGTYLRDASVYFDVQAYMKKFKYGELSGRNVDELFENTRELDGQEEKRFFADFSP